MSAHLKQIDACTGSRQPILILARIANGEKRYELFESTIKKVTSVVTACFIMNKDTETRTGAEAGYNWLRSAAVRDAVLGPASSRRSRRQQRPGVRRHIVRRSSCAAAGHRGQWANSRHRLESVLPAG